MKRLAVLISGGGSNLQALIDAVAAKLIPGRIVVVGSDRAGAFGLKRAEAAGIATFVMALRNGDDREAYDLALAERLAATDPDLIVLAGFMRILGRGFLDQFAGRVINLHPALPGDLPGKGAIERAYAEFARGSRQQSGVMVHEAIAEVDAGPVLGSAVVPFHSGDTLHEFAARMHRAEHQLLVEVVVASMQA